MDFKWEMQMRIDAGMHPDEAYNATRDFQAAVSDNKEKFAPVCGPNGCDSLPVCFCTCDNDCECKARDDGT